MKRLPINGTLFVILFATLLTGLGADTVYKLIPTEIMTYHASMGGEEKNLDFNVAVGGSSERENVVSKNALGNDVYKFGLTTIGHQYSVVKDDYTVGEYCTYFPASAEDIDWTRTRDSIQQSEAYRNGYVYFFENEEDPNRRILFTRKGTCSIVWKLSNGDSFENVYTIGLNVSKRPHRLYWTSDPFNFPEVLVSGKYIKLLGDPGLIESEYTVDSKSGVTNLVKGVVYDSGNGIISALCKVTKDAMGKEVYDGPEGQFVVAYFDSGRYDNLIGSIVVQVSGPDPQYLNNNVGDVLLPVGGGYGIDGLTPSIIKGLSIEENDSRSPYLYYNKPSDKNNSKYGNIYAISPTTNSPEGALKVSIVWQAPDEMDVIWPFEQVNYNISWPTDMVKMLVGNNEKDVGTGMLVNKNYAIELCDYAEPKGVASVESNVIKASSGDGKFTVKVNNGEDVWFIPFETISNTNEIFDVSPFPWYIGTEVKLRGFSSKKKSLDIIQTVNTEFPGYIYQPIQNKLINPNLYHIPTSDLLDTSTPKTYDDEVPRIEQLESSIFLVNTENGAGDCTNPLEVWWYDLVQEDDMPYPIAVPVLPQVYKPVWPEPDEVHNIAIASQIGSKAESFTASKKALYLSDSNSHAQIVREDIMDKGDSLLMSFWMNVNPRSSFGYTGTQSGALFSINATNNFSFVVKYDDSRKSLVFENYRLSYLDGAILRLPDIEEDTWYYLNMEFTKKPDANYYDVGIVLSANSFSSLKDEDVLAEMVHPVHTNFTSFVSLSDCEINIGKYGKLNLPSAVNVAIDDIVASYYVNTNLDDGEEDTHEFNDVFNYTFDDDSDLSVIKGTTSRFAKDELTGRKIVIDHVLSLDPGAPSFGKTTIPYTDEVAPRIYVQNDDTKIGYNPNEEHTLMYLEYGEYVVYPLRTDLNITEDTSSQAFSSKPFVLVECENNGKGDMRIFSVSLTNNLYTSLSKDIIAGNMISGPHPFDKLDGFYNDSNFTRAKPRRVKTGESVGENGVVTETYSDVYIEDGNPAYVDRKKRLWARRDGAFDQFIYYPVQEGFAFPSVSKNVPAVGTLIPWMNCYGKSNKSDVINGDPLPWEWNVTWPDDAGVPKMYVGQTLTTAINGLPEVWSASSMGISYPSVVNGTNVNEVVKLIDPTVAQYSGLPINQDFVSDYGFSLGSTGTATLKSGKYYLKGLPPTISDRFYIDTTRPTDSNVVLIGQMAGKTGGVQYLQMNVLSSHERQALIDICKSEDSLKRAAWANAINNLAQDIVEPTKQVCVSSEKNKSEVQSPIEKCKGSIKNKYTPIDHYGLVASGIGSGYVTIIENDGPTDNGMVNEGDPISMHIIKVVPELYTAPLVVLEDPNNKLSEQLDILYSAPFGKSADNFEFEWRKISPPADGSVPSNYEIWDVSHTGKGLTEIHLGTSASNLKELSNTYYALHYKALPNTKVYETVGAGWSDWCGPTLAEGWIQRVMNTITPFAQRLDDFYNNPAELALTMPEQIGSPYQGDIALNMDNLANVGLLELYHTVLNKAESMSLSIDETDLSANKQLLLAVSRMADLYMLLGGDAYADAKNPTVAVGDDNLPSSIYCFQNQVPSLLDEELALLRGRTHSIAPSTTTYPYFNRLMWNFTKGVTEGELAYVNNYNIISGDGVITAERAAELYPQGHGDAYGHYLSAVKLYYRLLRNPAYYWGDPAMMEMLVNDAVVNMDYEDEQKMATAAAKLAQTAIDVIDLTARKQWKDTSGNIRTSYFDNYKAKPNPNSNVEQEQGFGYGEWAVRSGLGAFYNWATVNSLLPSSITNGVYYFKDDTIGNITRDKVEALSFLADSVNMIEEKMNQLDSGLNPLNLSNNAVPFDISPIAMLKDETHYDQIYDRAIRALDNAETTLKYANKYGSRLNQIYKTTGDLAVEFEEMEEGYRRELISIFGTPYSDDIGPSGTYPQGYNGPDLYHYMWMNLSEFAISSLDLNNTTNIVVYKPMDGLPAGTGSFDLNEEETFRVSYDITRGGIIVKPSSIKGSRLCEGSLQSAYREYLSAFNDVEDAVFFYKKSVHILKKESSYLYSKMAMEAAIFGLEEIYNLAIGGKNVMDSIFDCGIRSLKLVKDKVEGATNVAVSATPGIVGVGLTVNTDLKALVSGAVGVASSITLGAADAAIYTMENYKDLLELAAKEAELVIDELKLGFDYWDTRLEIYRAFEEATIDVQEKARALVGAWSKLASAEEVFKAELQKGMLILEEREMKRKFQSDTATPLRYADMYYRVQRNDALSKYNSSFDIAQRYVYMLAKVYDYETGLLSSDPQAGDRFLSEIIGTRSLGTKDISIVSNGQDGGLWDVVNRMHSNMNVLKGRLGMYDAIRDTKWFSLRYSLFRIAPDESGDAAWEKELSKYWVDDINKNPEFARYCQAPRSSTASTQAEPGLIIPFSTSINVAENFFGKPLSGGETTFSSSDFTTKILNIGVKFDGYNQAANGWSGLAALATSPNIYLVPVGNDLMRAPDGASGKVLSYKVINQVLPTPYVIGSNELNDSNWVASLKGLDGTTDSFAVLRKYSTLPEGGDLVWSRLLSRSVWNDKWLLVIPGSSLLADREKGLKMFIHGADLNGDGIQDQKPVRDITIGIKYFSRQGN